MFLFYYDFCLYYILGVNSLFVIGFGIVMIMIFWLLIKESGGEIIFGYVFIIVIFIMFLLILFIG